ncbi:hypothetical protein CEXT_356811 [Caerostris extrusa]|uniref:Uncharacterized protein n=1 Tax=Caerostris extrusa TaxID=172846 RepID=A0AAV4Y8P7_CAEEX|nr:hypothetical protein CEXT_356811 [Caerostris extrusa]
MFLFKTAPTSLPQTPPITEVPDSSVPLLAVQVSVPGPPGGPRAPERDGGAQEEERDAPDDDKEDKQTATLFFIQGACAASSLFPTRLVHHIIQQHPPPHPDGQEEAEQHGQGAAVPLALLHHRLQGLHPGALHQGVPLLALPLLHRTLGVMTIWVMHQQTRFCRKDGELHQCKGTCATWWWASLM